MFYREPDAWTGIVMQAARDILPGFDSDRLVREYHERLYREDGLTQTDREAWIAEARPES
jgi:hypothetical protein